MTMSSFSKISLILLISNLSILATASGQKNNLFVRGAIVRNTHRAVELEDEQQNKIFQTEIYGPAIWIEHENISAGELTIELDFLESYFNVPEKRTMAIFCNTQMLTPLLDVYVEANGKHKPLTKSYSYEHQGGKLSIRLESIENNACINATRIYDKAGKLLADMTAQQAKLTITTESGEKFRVLTVDELVWYHTDHAPIGAYSTLVYGYPHSGGLAMQGGRLTTQGQIMPEQGLIVAGKSDDSIRIMPFYKAPENQNQKGISYYNKKKVKRQLEPTTDNWHLPDGISWTHYSPSWKMSDINKAPKKDVKRFLLPATWIEFTIDNQTGKSDKQLLFSLQEHNSQARQWGRHKGYLINNKHVVSTSDKSSRLLSEREAEQQFGLRGATSAFLFCAKPGERKTVCLIVAHNNREAIGSQLPGYYAYTHFFKNWESILKAADKQFAASKAYCNNIDKNTLESLKVKSPYRSYLLAHSLHAYRYNTLVMGSKEGRYIWGVPEGQYGYLNTFDLVVDQLFYELAMHPWTIRNVLDLYADRYSYEDTIHNPLTQDTVRGGISFCHDMGMGAYFTPAGQSYYEDRNHKIWMTQEELQNWIICAGLYWKKSGDEAWLFRRKELIEKCLISMQRRDHPDAQQRDGITDYVTTRGRKEEITTYDALDHALKQTRNNLYIAVKSWACYTILEAMLNATGEQHLAEEARQSAVKTAQTVVSHFNKEESYIPAVFDGHNQSRIIPAVEALVYPYVMGLNVFSQDYNGCPLIETLKIHLDQVLKQGVCLDEHSGGWKLSSTSQNTWQSKVYISQYVAEEILGMENDPRIAKDVDAIHASFQALSSGAVSWSDQLRSTNGRPLGSKHYPRGVTSALWWFYTNK